MEWPVSRVDIAVFVLGFLTGALVPIVWGGFGQ